MELGNDTTQQTQRTFYVNNWIHSHGPRQLDTDLLYGVTGIMDLWPRDIRHDELPDTDRLVGTK